MRLYVFAALLAGLIAVSLCNGDPTTESTTAQPTTTEAPTTTKGDTTTGAPGDASTITKDAADTTTAGQKETTTSGPTESTKEPETTVSGQTAASTMTGGPTTAPTAKATTGAPVTLPSHGETLRFSLPNLPTKAIDTSEIDKQVTAIKAEVAKLTDKVNSLIGTFTGTGSGSSQFNKLKKAQGNLKKQQDLYQAQVVAYDSITSNSKNFTDRLNALQAFPAACGGGERLPDYATCFSTHC